MDTQMDKVGLLQQGSAAIVTGAASGIGKATALALASCGVKLTLLDLDTIQGSELVGVIPHQRAGVRILICTNDGSSIAPKDVLSNGPTYI